MRIIDTHSHMYSEEFDSDRDEAMKRALDAGVERVILPGLDLKTLPSLLEMCDRYPDVCFPLLGLHPTELDHTCAEVLDEMEKMLVPGHRFIGIGEIGMDLYWDSTYQKEQEYSLERQVEWALRFDLPIVLHCRNAHRQMMDILSKYKGEQKLRGIFHCFGGTEEERDEMLSYSGFYLGIGGTLTYKKSKLPQVISSVPLERIVVETDAPYLAPVPMRGKRNETAFVYHTVQYLASVMGCNAETVGEVTANNAIRLFWGAAGDGYI